eukprot:scaffold15118_cov109-Isochrysis_galbana.AAC.1
MLFICCCIAATICVMSEPSEEGAAAVGGRSSLFVRTEIIFADVDAGGLVGHPLSVLDADSCSGQQFLELHGVISTPLLGRLVPGENDNHAVVDFMRHMSVIPNRTDIYAGLITLLLHVGSSERPGHFHDVHTLLTFKHLVPGDGG